MGSSWYGGRCRPLGPELTPGPEEGDPSPLIGRRVDPIGPLDSSLGELGLVLAAEDPPGAGASGS